jgi:VIT1/CCC1 family predicted Fe2+/Mn2+ transporter
MAIGEDLRDRLLVYQKNEITEHRIYRRLAEAAGSDDEREVLSRIAADEREHYRKWRSYTGKDVKASALMFWKYYLVSRVFGFAFGLKLMERNEATAQDDYKRLKGKVPEVDAVIEDEQRHEDDLVDLLGEERLRYTGSIVLGLNDALVEMLGALAGLTFALQNTSLIALSAMTTGIAAAMSMGASEYLSTKTEQTDKRPFNSSLYTGFTSLLIVMVLVTPYLLFDNYYVCFGASLLLALAAIGLFNFYMAVAGDQSFAKRFGEMAGLSLGVAALSFLVGNALRFLLDVNVP